MRLLSLLLLLLSALPAEGDERILDFNSDVHINRSGELTVTENITVRSEREQIRHGIYRDFPTTYEGSNGISESVTFIPQSAMLDGEPVAYHTKELSNGVRVYMGDPDRFLANGEHRFTLTYHTDRQLGFFTDHDELYWNVNGNGWDFPIDRVEATVHLPAQVPSDRITNEAYTGDFGDNGRDYRSEMKANGAVHFSTTVPLSPKQGMTIVVDWPKGYVREPTRSEKINWLLHDNINLIAAFIGLVLLLVYYFLVWRIHGRDPEKGVIIPRYEPPKGFSPASSRYILRMGYDDKAFTAAVVNLAVKGLVEIQQLGKGYILKYCQGNTQNLAPGEKILIRELFNDDDTLVLKQSEHSRISRALNKHQNLLKRDYEKIYFNTNGSWVFPGVGITFLFLMITATFSTTDAPAIFAIFIAVWLTIWSLGVYALGSRVFDAWRTPSFSAISMTLFFIPFFSGELLAIGMLYYFAGTATVLFLLLAAGINALFYELLKAPTLAGRKLLDELEGFKLYLTVAEEDEMNLRNPPERTPELFEAYLPYALALNLEQQWAERFASVFAQLDAQQAHYQPGWYQSSSFSTASIGSFAGGLGSNFTSAVSASSTAPGSSSGSSGGGSSGGGGGGGGGGGW